MACSAKACEQELKYLCDFGVYEKIDESEAMALFQVTSVDTKSVETDKAFEGEPMQIRSRIVAREFKSDDRPDLPQRNLINHAPLRVTCILPGKGSEARAGTITSGGQSGHRRWEHCFFFFEHVWHKWTQQVIGSVIGKSTLKAGAFNLGSARRIRSTRK